MSEPSFTAEQAEVLAKKIEAVEKLRRAEEAVAKAGAEVATFQAQLVRAGVFEIDLVYW